MKNLVLMMFLSVSFFQTAQAQDCKAWLEIARTRPSEKLTASEQKQFVAFAKGIDLQVRQAMASRASELKVTPEKYAQSNQAVDDLLVDSNRLVKTADALLAKDAAQLFCENLKIAARFQALYQQRFPPTDILVEKGAAINEGMNVVLRLLGIAI